MGDCKIIFNTKTSFLDIQTIFHFLMFKNMFISISTICLVQCYIQQIQKISYYVSFVIHASTFFLFFCLTDAYDSLDPNGNITIKWDIMQWTPDGYVVSTEDGHWPIFLKLYDAHMAYSFAFSLAMHNFTQFMIEKTTEINVKFKPYVFVEIILAQSVLN